MNISKQNLFTPVIYESPNTIGKKAANAVENYFALGGLKVTVLEKEGKNLEIIKDEPYTNSWKNSALKIASYFTVVLPIIMFIGKLIFRATHKFVEIDNKIILQKRQFTIRNTSLYKKLFNRPDLPELPNDVLKIIFAELNQKDLQSTSRVNKKWKELTLEATYQKEFRRVETFIDFAVANLSADLYPEQIETLRSIRGNKEILDTKNLIQIKIEKLKLWESIGIELNTLSNEDFNALEALKESPSHTFFFNYVRFHKSIDVALLITGSNGKDSTLKRIYNKLPKGGYSELAIRIANEMPHSKNNTLSKISSDLAATGDFEKAFEVALLITASNGKDTTLKRIYNTLPKDGYFELAIRIANEMPESKNNTLREISDNLATNLE